VISVGELFDTFGRCSLQSALRNVSLNFERRGFTLTQ